MERFADSVAGLEEALPAQMSRLGITRDFLRRVTSGPDTLFSPLRATREALYSDDPACVVVRAFFCGVPVRREELEHALGAPLPSLLLVEPGPGLVVCPFHARFVRHLLLFSDYVDSTPDAVMGAGETTAILYDASRPPQGVRSVLDLGCGAGTLALLLAQDAERVVGTDMNPRAVDIAAMNARINRIENAVFRSGDLYEPVAREYFDLIVSQPPYYPAETGAQEQMYLHGGTYGDEIARAVIAGIPDHLAPGGRAYVFACFPAGREHVEVPGFAVQQIRSAASEIPGTFQTLVVVS